MGLGTGALHNGIDHYRCNAFRIIKSRESNSLTLIASFTDLQPLHQAEAGSVGVWVAIGSAINNFLCLNFSLSQGKRGVKCKLYVYKLVSPELADLGMPPPRGE